MEKTPGEDEYIGPAEQVVQYSEMGSFMPIGSYRPVPIVWFAGAWFAQVGALLFLFVLLLDKSPILTVLATGLASFGIGHWTFGRGMSQASAAWRIFTVGTLLTQWGLVVLGEAALYGI